MSVWTAGEECSSSNIVGAHFVGIDGAQVHYRPAAVAQDNTTSIASVQEFLRRHPHVHNVALVQCTSVFLRAEHLRSARLLFDEGASGVVVDCVFAVVRWVG